MKNEIIELIVDNTGVSTEQAAIITKKILKLFNNEKIYLLKGFIEHPTKLGYKRHDVLDKINELEKKLKNK